jgi:hypothetical protein
LSIGVGGIGTIGFTVTVGGLGVVGVCEVAV